MFSTRRYSASVGAHNIRQKFRRTRVLAQLQLGIETAVLIVTSRGLSDQLLLMVSRQVVALITIN